MTGRVTSLLGIEAPIVLAPFGGLSSVPLTATVSQLGGLGSYGLYGYSADRILSISAQLKAATTGPFALNLWLPTGSERAANPEEFQRALAAMTPFFEEMELPLPERPEAYLPGFDEQFEAVLTAAPAVVSFVYGVPPAELISAAHERNIVVLGTATTVDEAVALERGGVDAIVATGAEAAGHRVSFLLPPELSLVGTFALVPQVADAVRVPVIAAGGIAERRGVRAAFELGADGVQVGTAFLRTTKSAANEAHRRMIATTPAHGTVLTRAMSGRLARGAPNRATRTLGASRAVAPFPAQNWLTGRFRSEAAKRNRGDLQSLWLGQAAPLATLDEAEAVFEELSAGLPARSPED